MFSGSVGNTDGRDAGGDRQAQPQRGPRAVRTVQPPGESILGIAGNVNVTEIQELVGELFGGWVDQPSATACDGPAWSSPRPYPPGGDTDADRHRLPQRPVSRPRLLSGVGGGRRAVGRHEFPAVHRGPRAARPVLQRVRVATTRCAIRRRCCATPARAPSGPRRRST